MLSHHFDYIPLMCSHPTTLPVLLLNLHTFDTIMLFPYVAMKRCEPPQEHQANNLEEDLNLHYNSAAAEFSTRAPLLPGIPAMAPGWVRIGLRYHPRP